MYKLVRLPSNAIDASSHIRISSIVESMSLQTKINKLITLITVIGEYYKYPNNIHKIIGEG